MDDAYKRLAALDISSHAAITPLHRLFGAVHAENGSAFEVIEADERQRQMVETGVNGMRERGYALKPSKSCPCLKPCELEQWQRFHSKNMFA